MHCQTSESKRNLCYRKAAAVLGFKIDSHAVDDLVLVFLTVCCALKTQRWSLNWKMPRSLGFYKTEVILAWNGNDAFCSKLEPWRSSSFLQSFVIRNLDQQFAFFLFLSLAGVHDHWRLKLKVPSNRCHGAVLLLEQEAPKQVLQDRPVHHR